MNFKAVRIGRTAGAEVVIADNRPFTLIGGLNVLEDLDSTLYACEHFVNVTRRLSIPYIFNAFFASMKITGRLDKAKR